MKQMKTKNVNYKKQSENALIALKISLGLINLIQN